MSEKEIITTVASLTTSQARSINIASTSGNLDQFKKTAIAFTAAGMTYQDIAKAAATLGEKVEIRETNITFNSSQTDFKQISGVEEKEGSLIAWQKRGETVSIHPELVGVNPIGNELVTVSQDLTIKGNFPVSMEVIEGIAVSGEVEPVEKLESNVYLLAPAKLDKAA